MSPCSASKSLTINGFGLPGSADWRVGLGGRAGTLYETVTRATFARAFTSLLVANRRTESQRSLFNPAPPFGLPLLGLPADQLEPIPVSLKKSRVYVPADTSPLIKPAQLRHRWTEGFCGTVFLLAKSSVAPRFACSTAQALSALDFLFDRRIRRAAMNYALGAPRRSDHDTP